MIAYLQGEIIKKMDKGVILLAGHIGHFLYLNAPSLEEIQTETENNFFIHSHIREDCFDLYGFNTWEELKFFKKLIQIKGVGPKVALEILGAGANKVKAAILNEDIPFIKLIPGIGAKTAQRIILELKNSLAEEDLGELERSYQGLEQSSNNDEIVDALIGLGYKRKDVIHNLRKIPKEIIKVEEIITFFIKNQ
jgi:holliday junction DNA helicase RuvA